MKRATPRAQNSAGRAELGKLDSMTDPVQQLAQIDLFSGLLPAALERIAKVTNEESFERGELIFEHGANGDKLYLILEGKVRVSRTVPGGGEEALAVLGAGQAFGEMALLEDTVRSADARAHERCRVLSLPKDGFDDLLFMDKNLAYEVLWGMVHMLVGRLRETTDKLTFLSASGKF